MFHRPTGPRRARVSAAVPLALAGVLGLTLSACGSDDTAPTASASTSQEAHNDADVAFASQMVPHHQQALTMVDLAAGRPLDPSVTSLVQGIETAQAPEIQTMSGWLADWGQPVPTPTSTEADPQGMGGMDMSGGSMPGMMTEGQMRQLADAPDQGFARLWLRMMIGHHQGAVEMARTEVAEGQYPPAIALAQSIIDSQSAEIATMKRLLAR